MSVCWLFYQLYDISNFYFLIFWPTIIFILFEFGFLYSIRNIKLNRFKLLFLIISGLLLIALSLAFSNFTYSHCLPTKDPEIHDSDVYELLVGYFLGLVSPILLWPLGIYLLHRMRIKKGSN